MGGYGIETKFLRLFRCVNLGDRIDEWRVCWVGGWDKGRVVFVLMAERPIATVRSVDTCFISQIITDTY